MRRWDCGHLPVELNGNDELDFCFMDPFPKSGEQAGRVREEDVPTAVYEFYCEMRV